jgi:heme/copper-type cytochrome/quinol oxidase subunit 2
MIMENEKPTSVLNWMMTQLLTAIPVIGLIMLFVWAFGGGAEISKRNWARATLLWAVISIVLLALLTLIVGYRYIYW